MLMDGLGFLEHAAAVGVHTATEKVEIPALEVLGNTILASFLVVRHFLQVFCAER